MTLKHDCPGGCGRSVDHHYLACRLCWFKLPHDLRSAVWATWRNREADPAAHRAAMADAITWYRDQGAAV